ncbi:Helicase conserved C-terminal domain-containing protein [Paenibacillus uliginis N3/975]|uniref:Helicase conserved C-terminal domain-containing protein n=1 Tax=Paenibacillus uliginis N3/975 TaxID=1313296 RepID=A0A1X7HK02_9BACL|nr:helicase-associated domain-containing protein [Paenibacillus uliginis]SMF87966.1 Helicase conserved C-terminal domain-containing protein [Paenibacillus uliginis N3/975]
MMDIQDRSPRQLPTSEQNVLYRIWTAFAGQVFDEEKLLSLDIPPLIGAEVLTAFLGLRQDGWVKAVKKAWGERLYFIPSERLLFVQEAFFTPSQTLEEVSAAILSFEAKLGLALDVFNALVYGAKNGGFPLTSKGTVHKKHIQKLDEPEGLTGSDIAAIGLQYAHSDAYPPRAAVLLDLLLSLGLLSKESNALVLKEDALQEWLDLSLERMNSLLFQSIMERYGRTNPESQHLRQLLCHKGFREDVWYDVDRLLDEMTAAGIEMKERRNELYDEGKAWLRFLAGAGWADVGTSNDEHLLIRWKIPAGRFLKGEVDDRTASATGYLFIQPDYEVMVPPDTPFSVRWSLAQCAERVSDDHMSVYRLTKGSVALAADLGMSPEQVTDFIVSQALSGVPDNVAAALAQWGREVGRTSFAELTVMQCETVEEGDQIAAHPKLTEWIHRLGPLYFAVKPEHVTEIRKILTVAGLPPKRQIGGFDQTAGQWRQEEHRQAEAERTDSLYRKGDYDHFKSSGLVYSGRNEHYFQPDSEIPDKQDLFPGLAKIPVMWTRDWRSYHSTTAKQIMEQALDWKVKVELGMENKKTEFIPKRLFRNPWRVSGLIYSSDSEKPEQIELSEGGWQEMRLIVPGQS